MKHELSFLAEIDETMYTSEWTCWGSCCITRLFLAGLGPYSIPWSISQGKVHHQISLLSIALLSCPYTKVIRPICLNFATAMHLEFDRSTHEWITAGKHNTAFCTFLSIFFGSKTATAEKREPQLLSLFMCVDLKLPLSPDGYHHSVLKC